MKITRIETIPVFVPLKPDMTTITAHGKHAESPYVIVRVHTDEGVIGLGEATVSPRWSGETSPGCVAIIQGLIAPALIGADPRQITLLRQTMDRVVRFNPFTKAAVEMALWDVAGMAAGLPVYQLLGGKVRDEMPIRLMIGAFEPAQAAALAKKFLAQGVRCLKVKVGVQPEEDFERVKAVREVAGPALPLTVDANTGWDFTTARRLLRKLEPLNILFAEQPIAHDHPDDLARLRAETGIPIMADESVFTPADAREVIRRHAADIISVYPGKNGGIAATLEIAALARAAGLSCSMGSNLELGVATAAMLHAGAAGPNIASERYPGDFLGPLYHVSDLLKQPLRLGPPAARVPAGPGLGVELDEDALERYRDHSQVARPIG